MGTQQYLPFEDDLLQKYSRTISEKYNISMEQSVELAIDAMYAYESHGGTARDFDGMMKVIAVVVKSWVEKDQNE